MTATPKGFSGNLDKGGFRFWLLALVLGFVLPPVGVVLAGWLALRTVKGDKKLQGLLIALAILVLSSVGSYMYLRIYSDWVGDRLYSYTFSATDTYTLTGTSEEISFQKPTKLIVAGESESINNTGKTVILTSDRKTPGPIAKIATSYARKASPVYIADISKILNKPSGESYEQYTKPLQEYLKPLISSGQILLFNKAQAFTNKNIKADAWQFDFTIKSSKPESTQLFSGKKRNYDQQGKLILIFAKEGTYYFVASDIVHNWIENQTNWSNIFNSIKVK